MDPHMMPILFFIFGLFIGTTIVIVIYKIRRTSIANRAANLISEAVAKAEEAKQKSLTEIKEESLRVKRETEQET